MGITMSKAKARRPVLRTLYIHEGREWITGMKHDWTALGLHKRHLRNWHPTGPPRCLAREDALCSLKYSPTPSICDPSTFPTF